MYSICGIPLIVLSMIAWLFFGKDKLSVVSAKVFFVGLSFIVLLEVDEDGCIFWIFWKMIELICGFWSILCEFFCILFRYNVYYRAFSKWMCGFLWRFMAYCSSLRHDFIVLMSIYYYPINITNRRWRNIDVVLHCYRKLLNTVHGTRVISLVFNHVLSNFFVLGNFLWL